MLVLFFGRMVRILFVNFLFGYVVKFVFSLLLMLISVVCVLGIVVFSYMVLSLLILVKGVLVDIVILFLIFKV